MGRCECGKSVDECSEHNLRSPKEEARRFRACNIGEDEDHFDHYVPFYGPDEIIRVARALEELDEYRSGKRRVFWRTRRDGASGEIDWTYRKDAMPFKHVGFRLVRVTVGPAKKKKEAG